MKESGSLFWLLKLHMKYPIKTLYVLFVSIFEVLVFTIPISITADVIEIAIEGGGLGVAKTKLILLFGVAIIQALLFFSISFLNEVLAHRVTTDITQELFESLQYRSLTYHDSQNVGDLMARATGDTRTVNIALSPAVRIILSILTIWIIIFTISSRIHFSLLLYSILIFIIFCITSYYYLKNIINLSKRTRQAFAEISDVAHNNLGGIKEIKSFTSQNWANKRLIIKSEKSEKSKNCEIAEGKKSAWFYPIFVLIFYSASIIGLSLYFAYFGLFGVQIRDVILVAGMVTLLTGISEELRWTMSFIIRGKAAPIDYLK